MVVGSFFRCIKKRNNYFICKDTPLLEAFRVGYLKVRGILLVLCYHNDNKIYLFNLHKFRFWFENQNKVKD